MAKQDNTDLLLFLRPFTLRIQELTLWLRDFVWDLYPESNELIYDNYNAVAFGWSPSHTLAIRFVLLQCQMINTYTSGFTGVHTLPILKKCCWVTAASTVISKLKIKKTSPPDISPNL